MSLRDRQVQYLQNQILQNKLKAGQIPDPQEIGDMLQQIMAEKPLGIPQFQWTPFEDGKPSDPDMYNQMIQQMYADLCLAFDELRDQQNQLLAIADLYETEKNRIQWDINTTLRRIESLQERTRQSSSSTIYTSHFWTFFDVELEGDPNRNIPKTDAFIDLRTGQARLNRMAQNTIQYDISNATISVKSLTSGTTSTMLSSPEAILKDTLNEIWQNQVIMANSGPVSIQVTVDLQTPIEISSIAWFSESPGSTTISCDTSTDGVNYTSHSAITTTNLAIWNISLQSVRYLRFTLSKNEEDQKDGTNYVYLFGASRLVIKREQYQSTAILVSRAFPVNQPTNKIQIQPLQSIPPGTAIQYFIGEDDGVHPIEWIQANDSGEVTLGKFQDQTELIVPGQPGMGDLFGTYYSRDYYILSVLSKTPIPGKTQCYIGTDMWQVETIPAISVSEAGPGSWTTVLPVAIQRQLVRIEKTTNGSLFSLTTGSNQRFTQFVYMSQSTDPYMVTLEKTPEVSLSLYLNNRLVKGVETSQGTRFILYLNQGINTIQVYTYTPSDAKDPKLALNMDFRFQAQWVRAIKDSLQEVSMDRLIHNLSKGEWALFAIKDNQLVIPFSPIDIDTEKRGMQGVIDYTYIRSPNAPAIRLLAKFSRSKSAGEQTPALSQYSLIMG